MRTKLVKESIFKGPTKEELFSRLEAPDALYAIAIYGDIEDFNKYFLPKYREELKTEEIDIDHMASYKTMNTVYSSRDYIVRRGESQMYKKLVELGLVPSIEDLVFACFDCNKEIVDIILDYYHEDSLFDELLGIQNIIDALEAAISNNCAAIVNKILSQLEYIPTEMKEGIEYETGHLLKSRDYSDVREVLENYGFFDDES